MATTTEPYGCLINNVFNYAIAMAVLSHPSLQTSVALRWLTFIPLCFACHSMYSMFCVPSSAWEAPSASWPNMALGHPRYQLKRGGEKRKNSQLGNDFLFATIFKENNSEALVHVDAVHPNGKPGELNQQKPQGKQDRSTAIFQRKR